MVAAATSAAAALVSVARSLTQMSQISHCSF